MMGIGHHLIDLTAGNTKGELRKEVGNDPKIHGFSAVRPRACATQRWAAPLDIAKKDKVVKYKGFVKFRSACGEEDIRNPILDHLSEF